MLAGLAKKGSEQVHVAADRWTNLDYSGSHSNPKRKRVRRRHLSSLTRRVTMSRTATISQDRE